MKAKEALKTVYILSCISLFLPWFTYNAKMMGYCWGFRFLIWFIIPMGIIGAFVFAGKRADFLSVLAELSSAVNIGILVFAFGRWQESSNIIAGFQWKDGFRTATPGFWISALLFILLFAFIQIVSISGRHNIGNVDDMPR